MKNNPPSHTPNMWALSNEVIVTKKSKFSLSTEKEPSNPETNSDGQQRSDKIQKLRLQFYSPKLICGNWQ
jgi:hypothetical protein